MKKLSGIELIAKERERQISEEGWAAEHDDEHEMGELASAAICYASPFQPFMLERRTDEYRFRDAFPPSWDSEWDKRERYEEDGIEQLGCETYLVAQAEVIENIVLPIPKRIRNLVKAGALIAAEIDRLQRIKED